MDGIYVVTATAQAADARQDSAIGAVNIDGLKGDALANAMMDALRSMGVSAMDMPFTPEKVWRAVRGLPPR